MPTRCGGGGGGGGDSSRSRGGCDVVKLDICRDIESPCLMAAGGASGS
jgi:hypothetical protein